MQLGTQLSREQVDQLGDDRYFRQLVQLGVTNVCVDPPGSPDNWNPDHLARHREYIESFGLSLDMIQLPLSADPIAASQSPNIMLGRSPQRDWEIDRICSILTALAEVGIPAAKYNLNILGIPRTDREESRGGAVSEAFRLNRVLDRDVPGPAGVVDAETYWARIEYFLERVVPVAEASRVRIACHPHDPCTPDGFRGVDAVLGTVDGLKRFVQTQESSYHGLNFCQGTIAESLRNPRGEIEEVIRWFGERGKIFNVHLRNIQGGVGSFREVLPDDGDMDLLASVRLYKELGYMHMIMPDHVPAISGAAPKETAFAFCFGYIAAALQMAESNS